MKFALLLSFAVAVTAFDNIIITRDDGGPDDEVAQADLNYMGFDDSHGETEGYYVLAWAWDDTVYSGGNTGDACALFDLNANGLADYSLCVSIETSATTGVAVKKEVILFDCKDTRDNACPYNSGAAGIIAKTDDGNGDGPLKTGTGVIRQTNCALQQQTDIFGNRATQDYSAATGDNGQDTAVVCQIFLEDLVETTAGAVQPTGRAMLMNVCSFPSPEPTSNAKDCVVTVGSGFLALHKFLGGSATEDTPSFNFEYNGILLHTQQGSGWSYAFPLPQGTALLEEIETTQLGVTFVEWICDDGTRSATNPVEVSIMPGQRVVCHAINWQGTVPADYTTQIDLDGDPATFAPTNINGFVTTKTPTTRRPTPAPTTPMPTPVGYVPPTPACVPPFCGFTAAPSPRPVFDGTTEEPYWDDPTDVLSGSESVLAAFGAVLLGALVAR
jgi:hypothetical protein